MLLAGGAGQRMLGRPKPIVSVIGFDPVADLRAGHLVTESGLVVVHRSTPRTSPEQHSNVLGVVNLRGPQKVVSGAMRQV